MNKPLFSVIVTTHFRPQLLARALASLKAQTFRDFEVVVVSDEPSEATHATAGRLLDERDVYIRRRGVPGPGISRNAGLRAAAGEFVLFLDDDDSFEPELLSRLADSGKLDARAVLYCNAEEIIESRATMPPKPLSSGRANNSQADLQQLMVTNFLSNNGVVVPHHAAGRFGFDESLRCLEDWDFLIALFLHNPFRHVDVFGPRVHRDQSGLNHRNTYVGSAAGQAALDFLSVYRKWPGRSDAERQKRAEQLGKWGMRVPPDWL